MFNQIFNVIIIYYYYFDRYFDFENFQITIFLNYYLAAPESLKLRISVYEKECTSTTAVNTLNAGNLQFAQQRPNPSIPNFKPIQL